VPCSGACYGVTDAHPPLATLPVAVGLRAPAVLIQPRLLRPRVLLLDAGSWRLRLIQWIHATLGAVALVPCNPKRQTTAGACHRPGQPTSRASAAVSCASSAAHSVSSVCFTC